MRPQFELKRGDTLTADCVHRDDAGAPIDLTGMTINSSVQSMDGSKSYPLNVTINPDQVAHKGEYAIEGDTSTWEPGYSLKWDIRYVQSDNTSFSTNTIFFTLNEAIS